MGGGFGGLDCRLYLGCEITKPKRRTNKVLLNMIVWTTALTAREVALALQWPLPGKSSETNKPWAGSAGDRAEAAHCALCAQVSSKMESWGQTENGGYGRERWYFRWCEVAGPLRIR